MRDIENSPKFLQRNLNTDMQILAIGNSFSQDATANLKRIADATKEDITVVNLVIGGCSLSRHYRNMLSEESVYSMEFNGVATGFFVSL